MFGLGIGEILIILAFALIFIGPKKLPELAKSLGKGLREFQKAKDEILHNMNDHQQYNQNNSAQQFSDGDHIDAEVTGVSEEDPDDFDHAHHDEYEDDLRLDEEDDKDDQTKKG